MPRGSDSVELIRALELLEAPRHLCATYPGAAAQLSIPVPFIEVGLRRGHRCVYIYDGSSGPALLEKLTADGVDTNEVTTTGALVLQGPPEPYEAERRLDPDHVASWIVGLANEATRGGYRGVSVMVDMKWTLGPHPGVERLATLEVKLEAALREAAPAIIACQYDRERFPGDIIREIIAIHPLVIDEQAVCRNPCYVSPEVYLAPDWPARELNWLLESIRRFQRADDASRASEQRYRSLARKLLELQERERQSLARELHDDLGQILTVIRFELQQERGEVATGRARVDGAIALVDQAVEIVRDLARELRPSMLDHLGLAVATRSYATRWAERAGWEAHLTIEEMERRLPPAVETACFSCACLSQIPHGPADRTDERALKWT